MSRRLRKSIALMLSIFIIMSFITIPSMATEPEALDSFDPGNYSLRLQGSGEIVEPQPNNVSFTPHQSINFPAATFEFSVWVRGNATELSIRAEGAGGDLHFVPSRTVNYSQWTQLTSTVVNTAGGWRTFIITASGAAGNDIFLDGFSLTGPAGTNLLANPGFETGTFANWFVTASWAVDWVGSPTNPGNNWTVEHPGTAGATTYTVTLATASTVPAENVAITPAGAQEAGTAMTVTVTPPEGYAIVADSLSVTGVADITLTTDGATFPMPAGGGEIVVNAEFEELELPPVTGVTFAEFTGRVDEMTGSEWGRVNHSYYTAGDLTLRTTSDGDVLYTIIEDATVWNRGVATGHARPDRDTRNVFYISIEGVQGFNFMGRPNVSYVVANGWLYRVLNDMTEYRSEYARPAQVNPTTDPADHVFRMTEMPEWFGADNDPGRDAERLSRIGMEYFRNWTGMRLRLDQIGNPDPEAVSISWRGMTGGVQGNTETARRGSAVHLPTNTATLLQATSFDRYRPEGVYFPVEDFDIIFNPLRGGGANLQSSEAPVHTCADPENCPATWIHTTTCPDTGEVIPFSEADGPLCGQFYGYAYVSWRSLEPEPGLFDWDNVRMYTKGDYPVVGPNMDQYQCARGNLVTKALAEYARLGVYVQLRFVMDYPFGSPFGYWYGDNYVGGWYDNDPQGLNRSHTELAMINLRNEAIADIPTWLIDRMREEPNRPNPACQHNIPNAPDQRFFVWCDVADDYVDDGLFDRMRDPSDENFYFWAQRWMSGYFHCTIPNPHPTNPTATAAGIVAPDLRVCPNGCVPYRRPAGLRARPSWGAGTGDWGTNQEHYGWHPSYFWGPEGVWYLTPPPQISGGVGLTPRYEHHLLTYYHERVIHALAGEIARENSVWNAAANIQLGSLGRWGEWHNWPPLDSGSFPNAELAYQFVTHYVEAFASNDNVQIGMRYPNWVLSRHNFGQFNDQTGHNNNIQYLQGMTGQNLAGNNAASLANLGGWAGHGGPTAGPGNINANMTNVPAFTGLSGAEYTTASQHSTHWMHAWTGGEYGDVSCPTNWFWQYVQFDVGLMGDLHRGAMHDYGRDSTAWGNANGINRVHIMNTLDSFRWTHVSNMAPRGPNAGRTNATTGDMQRAHKNNDAAYDNMGYRFTLEEVEVTGELERGETVDVRMVVNNRGVAPFYRSWPFEASFVDADGNVVGRQIIEDVDITEWMPRHRPINNARPAAQAFRYTADGVRIEYRSFAELGVAGNLFIPANDGRTEVEFTVTVPADLSDGEYNLAIAILDPILLQGEPGITFHNLGTRSDRRLVLEPFTVDAVIPTVEFTGTNPTLLAGLLETSNVILRTPGNLGIFAQHSPFTIPEGRTLYIQTTLNVQRDAELNIIGDLVVLPGGRLSNQLPGSTILIADGGTLTVNGTVENAAGSFFLNEGNVVVGSEGRLNIRASVTYCLETCGDVYVHDGGVVFIHANAIKRCVAPEPEDPETIED